jgi:predicted peroxiredoxin
MAKLMIHLTFGPESPTRATLALLVAKSALADGHEVSVFFVGDAVQLLRPKTVEAVQGVGTGSLKDHLDALVTGGASLYASRLSSDARGLTAEDVGDLPVQMSTPNQLVQLALDHDRVITY